MQKHYLYDIVYQLTQPKDINTFRVINRRCTEIVENLQTVDVRHKGTFQSYLLKYNPRHISCSLTDIQENGVHSLLQNANAEIELKIFPSEKLTNLNAIKLLSEKIISLNCQNSDNQILKLFKSMKNLHSITLDVVLFNEVFPLVESLPFLDEINITCHLNEMALEILTQIFANPKKLYHGTVRIFTIQNPKYFTQLQTNVVIRSGRYKLLIAGGVVGNELLLSANSNIVFDINFVRAGLKVASGTISNDKVSDVVREYLIQQLEITDGNNEVNLEKIPLQSVQVTGRLPPISFANCTTSLKYLIEDVQAAVVDEANQIETDMEFYTHLTFANELSFLMRAEFFGDVKFMKKVRFLGLTTFHATVKFHQEVEFIGSVEFLANVVFMSNVSFAGRVTGHDIVFQEHVEFWQEPHIRNPHYIRFLPDNMYGNVVEEEEQERNNEPRRTWWGGLVEDVERLENNNENNNQDNERFDNGDDDDEYWSDEENDMSEDEDEHLPQNFLQRQRNNVIEEPVRNVAENTDLRHCVNLLKIDLESKKQLPSFKLLLPTSITEIGVIGSIPLDNITTNPDKPFDIHLKQLNLCRCEIPSVFPTSITCLSLKQCTGNLDIISSLPLEELNIQTINTLSQLVIPTTVKKLSLTGLPHLASVEGSDNIEILKIGMCAKLSNIVLSKSLVSVELSMCIGVVKLFNPLHYPNLEYAKVNNKILQQ